MEWRQNDGFLITNQMTIGDSEIVLGIHTTRANLFATWECTDRYHYFGGRYFSTLLSAQKDFCQRGLNKVKFYEMNKSPKKNEPER